VRNSGDLRLFLSMDTLFSEDAKPRIAFMEIKRHWRLKAQRYRLEGSTWSTCDQPTFPPRLVDPHRTTQSVQIAGCGLSFIPTSNRIVNTVSSKG
jgi:hypothetical protein